LFQTIVGAWPPNLVLGDQPALDVYCRRLVAWQRKALREAKLQSDWSEPDEAYERTTTEFIGWLFARQSPLLDEIATFAQRIAPAGAANGLAQVLLKLTAPGVPDIYQGTEYWDLSLVDPDNRSPVDFALRQKTLAADSASRLAAEWPDGRIKQFLITRALAVRSERPQLFTQGQYLPLETTGPMAHHVIAFARLWQDSAAIVACCRFSARSFGADAPNALPFLRCTNTEIHIREECRGNYSEVLRGQKLAINRIMKASEILGTSPVALLTKY
jgi:(1->4)-alpha-D-glucan 1-alpha-D-glucosylmutase